MVDAPVAPTIHFPTSALRRRLKSRFCALVQPNRTFAALRLFATAPPESAIATVARLTHKRRIFCRLGSRRCV